MQQNEKMHPDDMRNLILFAALSIVLWLSYDHFILKPKMDAMKVAQEAAQKSAMEMQVESGMTSEGERPREDVILESRRVDINSDLLTGSINLTGGRFDDLTLTQYHETVEREKEVTILSPSGTEYPKYIEQGWVAADKSIAVPSKDSVWRLKRGNKLSADSSVVIEWNNNRGLTFERTLSLNEDYGFEVVQTVRNNTGNTVKLYPYSLVLRRGMPQDFLGRFIVHEGPMIYAGDSLSEKTFGKMEKKPSIVDAGDKGWAALTTKDWLTAIIPEQGVDTKFRMTYTKAASGNVKDRYQVDAMGPA